MFFPFQYATALIDGGLATLKRRRITDPAHRSLISQPFDPTGRRVLAAISCVQSASSRIANPAGAPPNSRPARLVRNDPHHRIQVFIPTAR